MSGWLIAWIVLEKLAVAVLVAYAILLARRTRRMAATLDDLSAAVAARASPAARTSARRVMNFRGHPTFEDVIVAAVIAIAAVAITLAVNQSWWQKFQ